MNIVTKSIIAASVCVSTVGMASAELIFYEGFDYTAGSAQHLTGNNGGTGDWTSAWAGSAAEYTIESGSISLPNLPFATAGNKTLATAEQRNRDFTSISTASDGTYYLSTLVSFDGAGTGGGVAGILLRSNFAEIFEMRLTAPDTLRLYAYPSDNNTSGGQSDTMTGFTHSGAAFMVVKIVVDADGDDAIYASAFSDGADIPMLEPDDLSWDLAITNANIYTPSINKLTLSAGSDASDSNTGYDEIRLATTYAEAVPVVPEPGSMILGLASAGLLLPRMRNRPDRS